MIQINGFNEIQRDKNNLKGHLLKKTLFFDVPNDFKDRDLYIYLPSTYDFNNPNKKFKVIYLMDGHDMFSEDLASYDGWNLDKRIEERISEGKEGLIIAAFDCPHDPDVRLVEMSITSDPASMSKIYHDNNGIGYGELLASFIVDVCKPLVEKTFNVKKGRENTAIGGASMGGLMAFYIASKYKDQFSFQLDYSPAFHVYKDDWFIEKLNNFKIPDNFPKMFLYVGVQEWEEKAISNLVFKTYEILESKGLNKNKLRFIFDSYYAHEEAPWSHYFKDALNYWLND